MAVTRDEVIWAYRLVLGREPGSESVISSQSSHKSILALRLALLRSAEFRNKFPQCLEDAQVISDAVKRTVSVFLHIPKCAGTSLHAILSAQPDRSLCPERHNGLANWSPAQLATFDLFSGHFDIESLNLIPAGKRKIVTLLRDPSRRLISLYRFLRAHTARAVELSGHNMGLVTLARQLDPVAFFRQPTLQRHPTINNGIVRQLTQTLPHKRWEKYAPGQCYAPALVDRDPAAAVKLACQNLENFASFGLQEHMESSVHRILAALGMPQVTNIPRRQELEGLVNTNPLLEPVTLIEMSEELAAALAPM
jgi:hypothetical protein